MRAGGTQTGSDSGGFVNTGNNPGNRNAPGYFNGGGSDRDSDSGSRPSGSTANSGSSAQDRATSVASSGGTGHQGSGNNAPSGGRPSGSSGSGSTPSRTDSAGRTPSDPGFVGPQPILLDLNGNGVGIDQIGRSTTYVDAGGDGLLHRTAWAAAGDGVLFYDPDGRNAITERRQYVFTDWDPTATSDMDAVRAVFDRNGDGKLTAADADFAKFKVLVTNADGSTTVRTLAQLGITEIALKPDTTVIVLPDGSKITGQSTFTRSNGTTGTVASATLVAEADGHRVVQTVSTDAAGNRVVVTTAYESDGAVAYAFTSVTRPDGTLVTNSHDDNGDGVTDRLQTITTTTAGDGARTETLVNLVGATLATAIQLNRTQTTTSIDGKAQTILRDTDGGGGFEQREVRTTATNGSRTTTISDLAENGATLRSVSETVQADGLTRTTRNDTDGDGLWDTIETHVIANVSGGGRTETVSVTNRNGSLRSRTVETESADGRSRTTVSDLDGDGDTDRTNATAITVNAAGVTVSTVTLRNGDGSLRSQATQTQSADTLVKTVVSDLDGDGDTDLTVVNATVLVADGSRHETTQTNQDGSVRGLMKVTLGADKVTSETWIDQNQDGTLQATDLVQSVTVNATTQARTATTWLRNPDGTFSAREIVVTSPDGLNVTTQRDADGNGVNDTTTTDVTVKNANGTSTRTVTTTNRDGGLRAKEIVTTSADGLTITRTADTDGNGANDLRIVDVRLLAGNGSSTRTASEFAGNGTTLLSRSTTTQSADRRTVTTVDDTDGDGATDRTRLSQEALDGTVTLTHTRSHADGSLAGREISVTSPNALVTTTSTDTDGNGTVERIVTDSVTLASDGSRTRTVDVNNGDGSDRSQTMTKVTDDGLQTIVWTDANGDGVNERRMTSTTVLNANGSVTTTDVTQASAGATLSRAQMQVSDDGLVRILRVDGDGDGDYDLVTTSTRTLLADGGTRDVTELRNLAGVLRSRTQVDASDDGRSITTTFDTNGDGVTDRSLTRIVGANGTVTETELRLNADGSRQSRAERAVTDDGLIEATLRDADGDHRGDWRTTDTTVLNANGSTTRTLLEQNQTGAIYRKTVVTTSDDGRVQTRAEDLNADGANDLTVTRTLTLATNGVETVASTRVAASGALIGSESTVTSANKRNVTQTRDHDGNGIADHVTTTTRAADGTILSSDSYRSEAGSVMATRTVTTSGDGLQRTISTDRNGDGRADLVSVSDTVLATDGSVAGRVEFRDDRNILIASQETFVSDDGMQRRVALDVDGDGKVDFDTLDATSFASDGRVIRTQVTRDATRDALTEIARITSGNGLREQITADYTGNGSPDRITKLERSAEGGWTQATQQFTGGYRLARQLTETMSADGRSHNERLDLDGDGHDDRFVQTDIDLSGNRAIAFGDINPDGSTGKLVRSEDQANGARSLRSFDIGADGVMDIGQETLTRIDANGQTIVTFREIYGTQSLVYEQVTTSAANGLSAVITYDADGDGTIDGTTNRGTTLNADGSRTISETTRYADATLRAHHETAVSANGRTALARHDYDGNGIADKTALTVIGPDGRFTLTERAFNEGGVLGQTFVTETTGDGLVTTILRGGAMETLVRSAIGNGSYTWDNGVTAALNKVNIVVSHGVDALGVETWTATKTWKYQNAVGTLVNDTSTATARVDDQAKARLLSEAARLYDAVLDRDMDRVEVELLVEFVANGQLDRTALATALVGSGEFATRYGTLTHPEYVAQIYLNTFGRAPAMAELDAHLLAISQGSETRASIARDLAESVEHIVIGNAHLATNNFDVIMNPAQFERSLDREFIRTMLERIVTVAYGRDATAQELDFLSDRLQRDVDNPDDIVTRLLAVTGEIQGVATSSLRGLTSGNLITQAYLNATGRAADFDVYSNWKAHLDSGRITAAQFIASVATSVERLSVDNVHDLRTPPSVNTINGTSAAQTLTGTAGQDLISGLDGNDTITGGAGSDRLIGGTGADSLNGQDGNDFYVWSAGNGNDTINDTGASTIEEDTLVLTNVASSGVSLSRNSGSNSLIVTITATGEQITVINRFSNPATSYGIEAIAFSDGVTWTLDDILARTNVNGTSAAESLVGTAYADVLRGMGGNDTLVGHAGDDILVGHAGADVLWGGAVSSAAATNGNDTYKWTKGSGNDVINDWGQSLTEVDTLNLADVLPSEVLLSRLNNNNDLRVTVVPTGEILTIDERLQNASYGYGIEKIVFANGAVWALEDILSRTTVTGTTAAETLTGTAWRDNLIGLAGNDTLNGGNGDDVLTGGTGNDVLRGGTSSAAATNGQDVYVWSKGDGNDILVDYGQALTEIDRLELTDVGSGQVTLTRASGNADAVLTILPTGETITFDEQFQNAAYGYGVERIAFSDGIVWTRADILSRTAVNGTAAANSLAGTNLRDNLFGHDGNDTLTGNDGDDVLTGGKGVDSLVGGNGNDRYDWSKGDGNDTINDTATSTTEVDTLRLTDLLSSQVALSVSGISQSGANLVVTSVPTGEAITVLNRFHSSGSGYGVEVIEFADGVVTRVRNDAVATVEVTGTTAANALTGWAYRDVMSGGAGNDTLTGNGGDDSLTGGTGVDSLVGGNGSDSYVWARGDGNDTINDAGTSKTERDVLSLTDVASNGVTLSRAAGGTSLLVTVTATGEVLTVLNRYHSIANGYGIEAISFQDGVTWELEDILQRTNLNGSLNAESLVGTAYADNLNGRGGNDTLTGGDGDDAFNGGTGVDSIVGGNGHDRYVWFSGDGNDTINDAGTSLTEADVLDLRDVLPGGVTLTRTAGTNHLLVTITATGEVITVINRFHSLANGYGIEAIAFTDGTVWTLTDILDRTTVTGTAAANSIAGTAYRDNLFGLDGLDTLVGGDGDDVLTGGAGADILWGGAASATPTFNGKDTYVWSKGDGNDHIHDWGRSLTEVDTLVLTNVQSGEVALTRATNSRDLLIRIVPTGEIITIDERYQNRAYGYGVERITFADGSFWTLDDILARATATGTSAAENIVGTAYDNNIFGAAGNDTLVGGDGDDVLEGGAGADVMYGGGGGDTIAYTLSPTAVTVRLYQNVGYGGDAEGDTFSGIDNLTGSAHGDLLNGGAGNNVIRGLDGNDTIYGLDGADFIDLGEGVNQGNGGNHADTVIGGSSNDRIWGGDGNDLLDGMGGYDTINGDGGNDTLLGGTGFDSLRGGTGDDVLRGGDGKDTLLGDEGDDLLWGDTWDDLILGGPGSDTLNGGTGNDILDGGTELGQRDVFVFVRNDGADRINNFQNGVDRIQFDSPGLSFAGLTVTAAADGALVGYDPGDTILIAGMSVAQVTPDDFIFA